ncbi:hypothetical protein ACFQ07_03100 [Actinomadura adrarensis]|uniref:Uncharacterized protein n=1 Tax=Actinomadura adrarensis TaxID=1819600 RepID=A0ABW3CB77_9ACTN
MIDQVTDVLNRFGGASPIFVRGRAFERPYISPPTARAVRVGAPLDLAALDPSLVYLWIVDSKGDFRIAPEQDPSYTRLYPRRVYELSEGRPDHGLKHADLAAVNLRWWLPRMLRPPARTGGELRAELDSSDLPTGRWIMNDDSAYNSRRARLDRKVMTENNLYLVTELLAALGTDISCIVARARGVVDASGR